jgi:hypothetical protein
MVTRIADEGAPGVRDEGHLATLTHRVQKLGGPGPLVVLVIAYETALQAVGREEGTGSSGVLGSDNVHFL